MSEPPPRDKERTRGPLVRMWIYGVIAAIAGTVLVLVMDWTPAPAADAADDIDRLYDVLLIFSVPIFVLVMAVAIYSVVRFRARPGEMHDGPPIHGSTKLEVVWVLIPALIVTGLAVYGGFVLADIEEKREGEMVVNVTGQQFAWSFEYPQQGGEPVKATELVLPKDKPVHFKIRKRDVLHSFWVPEFRLKLDAVPGIEGDLRLTPNRTGTWQVVCAELCGLGHATMRQQVRVVDDAEFTAWLDEQKAPAQAEAGGGEEGAGGGEEAAAGGQGKAIFTEQGCGGCHVFADAGGSGTVGPDLDELASVAAEREPGKDAQAYVEEAITEPDAFVVEGFPEGTMPGDYGDKLTPEQIDQLVAYLLGGETE